jgi:hypothetical protein
MKETHITTKDSETVLIIQESDDMILVQIKTTVHDGMQHLHVVKKEIDFIQNKIFEKIDSIERKDRKFVVFENLYFEPNMHNKPKITIEYPDQTEHFIDGKMPENYMQMDIEQTKLFLQEMGKNI